MASVKDLYVQHLNKLLSEQSPHSRETGEANMLPSEIKKPQLGKGAEYGGGRTKAIIQKEQKEDTQQLSEIAPAAVLVPLARALAPAAGRVVAGAAARAAAKTGVKALATPTAQTIATKVGKVAGEQLVYSAGEELLNRINNPVDVSNPNGVQTESFRSTLANVVSGARQLGSDLKAAGKIAGDVMRGDPNTPVDLRDLKYTSNSSGNLGTGNNQQLGSQSSNPNNIPPQLPTMSSRISTAARTTRQVIGGLLRNVHQTPPPITGGRI